MSSIRVDMKGVDKTVRLFADLPKELDKHLSKTNSEFMEDVKETAKSLAPVDTGFLKESIVLAPVRKGTNVKKWKIVVGAEHGIHQEEGFTPHYAFIRNSAKLAPGRYFVKKNTPFMKPAIERNYGKYLNMLNASSKNAIMQSGR